MEIFPKPYPREQLEQCIRYLADRYPGCFFEDPGQRRPLKTNLVADLQKDGVSEEIIAGVSYYMRHFGYLRCLQAGAERVDLNGKKAGVVTEQEMLNAEKQFREQKEQIARKNAAATLPAISVIRSLHATGSIPTDQLRKVTLPATPTSTRRTAQPISPELARLQTLLASTNTILTETGDDSLRAALVGTSLKLLISEAQKALASLDGGTAPDVMEVGQ
jgi:sRNA-binding protein